jgi:hypothetical protein
LNNPVEISWSGGNLSGFVQISLINVTTNSIALQIDVIENTGEYVWIVGDGLAGTGDIYRFYIQEYPWPPSTWAYGSDFTISDTCIDIVFGCTDSTACNFNLLATDDDGSCLPDANGDGICDSMCPEDLDLDGFVTITDLLLILSEFGCTSSCSNDVNQDGFVTVEDLLLILSVFGTTCE